ncbi:glycine rich domain-containing protein [Bacteroides ndongoniae]|jgi:hypothetical protein|uniref:glycine rich domain-containing protein n=1 Tax=Bacteroides ndongoniae TaxID=1903262 RepID=UPI0023F63BCF|nr:glycine rich domain-containing protein [Bacteroides ndongoniae]
MNIDWLAITPQSGQAGTNPISFQLVSENESFEDKTIRIRAVCGNARSEKTIVLKGKSYPVGTVFNFAYTGSVQEITLPKGRYKLQCWGAQGGNVSGSYTATGSKGGYSEGVLTLTKPTTIYVFVGGQGTSSSTSNTSGTANGGWNGGGASTRYSSYDSSGTYGNSYPRPGGGATDMCLVTSTMNYSSGRTNRNTASLLSRFIVAGGAGASARYTKITTTTTHKEWVVVKSGTGYTPSSETSAGNYSTVITISPTSGNSYKVFLTTEARYKGINISGGGTASFGSEFTPAKGVWFSINITSTEPSVYYDYEVQEYKDVEESSTSSSNEKSNSSQQGGGVSGRGQYPGTQNSAGSGGAFGLGANQTNTNYRYDAGAGGGGWYGGGKGQSDTGTNYVNYSGGGSGFVNTAANAGYRPSGYTGLQLESGSTKDGSTSFVSPLGGNETGHSGNGYARVTVLE